MFMILVDNCGYYCVNFILFLENYVHCKEIISDFSLKWGGGGVSVIKWEGGLTFNEKFIKWGGVRVCY